MAVAVEDAPMSRLELAQLIRGVQTTETVAATREVTWAAMGFIHRVLYGLVKVRTLMVMNARDEAFQQVEWLHADALKELKAIVVTESVDAGLGGKYA
jgi:hypothetical protein